MICMNLEQAKAIIKSEREAPIGRLSFAAGVLCSPENADKVSLLELIECLRRGNERKRLSLVRFCPHWEDTGRSGGHA